MYLWGFSVPGKTNGDSSGGADPRFAQWMFLHVSGLFPCRPACIASQSRRILKTELERFDQVHIFRTGFSSVFGISSNWLPPAQQRPLDSV